MIYKIINGVIDILYPPRCPICDDIVSLAHGSLCDRCADNIQYVQEPYCMKCGKPLDDEGAEYCDDCTSKMHYYDENRAVLVYDEYTSKSIYRFKYNSKPEYAAYYGKLIDDRLHNKIKSWNAQALVPVPIHKSKLKSRGYNQAALIAKALSKHVNIPVCENLLIRKIPTKVMKNLDARQRENNLEKAFIVNENSVKLNSVVIVDDIYTTGSTMDAVARVLKDAGVEKVYCVSLSIGRGY